jgi:hypothetical protein
MDNRLEKWEKLGLLVKTPEERKEFVANSLELLIAYLNDKYDENDNGNFQTMIFPIFTKIGNEVDFGINDFFTIMNEVSLGLLNLKHDENSDVDEEAIFCNEYSKNKIKKFKGDNKLKNC